MGERKLSRYEIIEHTADVGIRIYGESLKSLFMNAAEALFDIVCGIESISEREQFRVTVEGRDAEDLMVAWLGELLLRFELENVLSRRFDITEINGKRLSALVWGEKFVREKHERRMEIKGVTYHRLKVEEKNGLWSAEVIFDV